MPLTSPYRPPSQLVKSPLLSEPLCFSNISRSNDSKIQQATLSFSTTNPTGSTPFHRFNLTDNNLGLCTKNVSPLIGRDGIHSVQKYIGSPIEGDEQERLDDEKRSGRLRVQSFVDTIRGLDSVERTAILDIVESNGGTITISEFNNLLMALLIANEPDLALRLYCNISSYGLAPDSRTLSIMVRCYCEKNDLAEAKQVLDHMVEIGFYPNVATFTILINSFCKRGRPQKAFEVFEVMARIGCKPNVQTYNCLLKGLCYVGRVEEAFEMLANIKKGSMKPDIYSYTAVMDGFCKVGRSKEAMELLDEALLMGLTPSVVTCNTLLNGYCKEGTPQKGISVLKQMKERNCMPDYISYSTLLNGLLKWGQIRAALRIYKEMVGIGFRVDESMMNSLLRGLCIRSWEENDLLEDAYEVFVKMQNGVSFIDPSTYGIVIRALCMGKKIDEALTHLQQIIRMGHIPRTITFNNVIQATCVQGKVEEALVVLVLMCEHNKIPSRTSYDILINNLNRRGMLMGACNLYGTALKQGVIPHRKPQECS